MPRARNAKEPSPVTVLVSQQETSQPTEQKPPQEHEEKPPNWFWDKLLDYPADEWKAGYVQVWLNRLGDSRVPMAPGGKGYLDMFLEPVTPVVIQQKYGGGKYQAVLNYRGRAVTSHNFEIVGEPKFDLTRERPSASPAVAAMQRENSDTSALATQFIQILREEMDHLRETNQAPDGANNAVVEMLSNASKKAVEAVAAQTGVNPATMMKEMVSAMKDLGLVGGQHEGSTLASLVKELTPLITLLTPLLSKFFSPQDPVDQATKFMALLDKVDALRGKGGSRGHTTTEDLILEGINKLPEVIQSLQSGKQPGQSPQLVRRVPTPGTGPGFPQQPAPRNAAPASATASAAPAPLRVTPIHSGSAPAEQAQPAAVDQQAQDAAAPPATAEEFHIAWVKRNIVEMFAMGQDAEKIAVFIDVQKPDLAADLGNYDVSAILGMIAMDPILVQITQIPFYELKIEAIRKELIEMAEDDETEEEEHAEPAPVN